MSTCRGCGTPNRPGRATCVACGEGLVSSDPPSEPGGPRPQTLPGAGAVANEPHLPQDQHEWVTPEVERTAAFDVAGFRPPTLLGVGASEAPSPPSDRNGTADPAPPTAEGAPEGPRSRPVPTTVPPSSVPPTEDPAEESATEDEGKDTSPTPVVGSAHRPSRRRRLLVASGLGIALAAASLILLLKDRVGTRADPPNVRTHVSLEGIGQAPPYGTLHVTAPANTKVTLEGTPLAPAPSVSLPRGEQILSRRVDLSADASGEDPIAHRLSRHLELDVSFADGSSRRSTVSFGVPVTPLTLTGPGPRWVVQPGTLVVSGKTQAGALVQAGTSRTRADPHGQFLLPVAKVGPGTLTVSAHAEGSVLRTVAIQVVAQAGAPPPLAPFEALGSRAGQRVRLEGKLVEARQRPAGTTLLLEVAHGCPAGGCRVSALQPLEPSGAGALTHAPGQQLTVVGDVTVTGSLPHLRAESVQAP